VTFYIRDAKSASPEKGSWRLDALRIDQLRDGEVWEKLHVYLPTDLSGLDSRGIIPQDFWFYTLHLPLEHMIQTQRGETIHVRVTFLASVYPYKKSISIDRYLDIFLSSHALPQGRASHQPGPRTWFYGDTHYHSSYTNDIKEFGAPLPETRLAGMGIGLDWIVVTDHSCDLDELDSDAEGKNRWERLKAEIVLPQLSDTNFRFILGEEITLVGKDEKYVHMLAIGNLQDLVPGAFLPYKSDRISVNIYIQAFKNILRFGKGYSPNLIQSMFGKLYSFVEVISLLPKDALLFAAHPYSYAQVPPATWDEDDLANLQLTGHEFWNTRIRRAAVWTDNPRTRTGWTNPDMLHKKDNSRIRSLKGYAKKWDLHLQRGVDEWDLTRPLPDRRPVFIGGSDAHGDFNYHNGAAWNYTSGNSLDDNALGKVRTAVYLPDHQTQDVPEEKEILAALKKGSCVVTDGPLLEFTLRQGQQVAQIGETLSYRKGALLMVDIIGRTTPEYGPMTEVEVISYISHLGIGRRVATKVRPGQPATLDIHGMAGYIRLETQTIGSNNENFYCFTNPIWFKSDQSHPQKIQIKFS
jgi:hypothetical protein